MNANKGTYMQPMTRRLEVDVTADPNFSIVFESRVIQAITEVVREL